MCNTLLVPLPRGVGADTFSWINFFSAHEWGRTICGRVHFIAVCWLKAPYDRHSNEYPPPPFQECDTIQHAEKMLMDILVPHRALGQW